MGKRPPFEFDQLSRALTLSAGMPQAPLDRRGFVQTSGGILVAAGLGAACSGDGPTLPTETGSQHAVVTGLDQAAVNGGQVMVTALDVPGFTPIPVSLPASGDSGPVPNIPVGNYRLAYTPPPNHALGAGEVSTKDVAVTANQETVVTWAVVPSQSTVRVTVTGLGGGAASGGTAAVLRTDIAGQSPVNLPIPVSGTADLGVVVGTYEVSYTPPANHTVNAGVQNPQTVTANAGQVAVASFMVTAGGTGNPTPNIVNNASFETGFDGFTDFGANNPSNVTRDNARAFAGSFALKRVLPTTSGGDIGGSLDYHLPTPVDRLWTRFYFYLDQRITGTLKFHQLYDAGYNTQFSGLYLHDGVLGCFFTPETQTAWMNIVDLNALVGAWHSLELDYWRNGDPSGFPSATVWVDDVQITGLLSGLPSPFSFSNGRIVFGARASSNKIANAHWVGILNGSPANTVAGNVWLDRIAISSAGRIGA